MPRRSPPARATSPDILRFHQALRARNAAPTTAPPRAGQPRRTNTHYDESGFPIPPQSQAGSKFTERVRRLLFTG